MDRENLLVLVSVSLFVFSLFSLTFNYGEFQDLMTGYAFADDSGQVSINLSKVLLYNFTLSEINWSTGFVDTNYDFAMIDTIGNVENGTWGAVTQGFEVRNLGNVNLTMNLSSGKSAAEFLGGTDPGYQINVTGLEADSCTAPLGFSLGQFYDVNSSPDSIEICESFVPSRNIRIDLRLVIPVDSNQGALNDTFSIAVSESEA